MYQISRYHKTVCLVGGGDYRVSGNIQVSGLGAVKIKFQLSVTM